MGINCSYLFHTVMYLYASRIAYKPCLAVEIDMVFCEGET